MEASIHHQGAHHIRLALVAPLQHRARVIGPGLCARRRHEPSSEMTPSAAPYVRPGFRRPIPFVLPGRPLEDSRREGFPSSSLRGLQERWDGQSPHHSRQS